MKSGQCPHCGKKISKDRLRCLKRSRAISCVYCGKGVRVKQSKISIFTLPFACLAGIFGEDIFNVSAMAGFIIIMIFVFGFTYLYLHFIGMYFPLEKADDEDLLL